MAVAELSPSELKRYYRHAKDKISQWENRSALASVATILSVLFVPTLGAKPFAVMAVLVAFSLFRFSVWEREASKAARKLYSADTGSEEG